MFGICRKRTVTGLKKILEQNDKEILDRAGDLFRRGTCDEPYGPKMRKKSITLFSTNRHGGRDTDTSTRRAYQQDKITHHQRMILEK